jgi:hypothetical protein
MKINECTIVAGKKDNALFLFKNGDNPVMYDHSIIRDIVNDIEVAYYTNTNGWCEGMSELGIGMVYAYFTKNDVANRRFELPGKTSLPKIKEIDPYFISDKGKYLLSIISSKTIDEGLEIIKVNDWDGNYYLSDGEKTYDIEKFEGQFAYRIVELHNKSATEVKTNHGQMLPLAGHLNNGTNLRRADSEIRKGNAERYLYGFSTFKDVIHRMSFQEFDPKSTFNLFRTDEKERTTSQLLLDLKNKKLNFIYYDHNGKFYGVLSKLPKDYKPKIIVNVFDRHDFMKSEYDEFKKKAQDIYTKQGQDFYYEK